MSPRGQGIYAYVTARPFYSAYRREPGRPYTEHNVLWPFMQFDTHRREYRQRRLVCAVLRP
jgi:hypothetical protein